MSDIAAVLKALLDPAGLPADFDPADARHACAAILDGGVDEFELGALTGALARHRYSLPVALGLRDALAARTNPLDLNAADAAVQPVVLPNYGCMHDGQVPAAALPLLALLLQRFGVPVLIHGAFETTAGLAVTSLLRDFGILPCATRAQATATLAAGGVAMLPLTLVSPGLAALMSLKARIGRETPGHALAPLLMPVRGRALQVCAGLSGERELAETCLDEGHDVLLALGETTAPFGNVAQRPRLELRRQEVWEVLFDIEPAGRAPLPSQPRAVEEWTRAALSGKAALPAPVANQLACCLYGAGYAQDMNQAKAIAAVETGSLAA